MIARFRQCFTPKEELNFLKAKSLRERRAQLLEKLKNIEEKNKILQQRLSDSSVLIRQQSEDIKSLNFEFH